MTTLISRLEEGSGADRELDRALHLALVQPVKPRAVRHDVVLPPNFGKDAISAALDPTPNYTSSIDAALALVEAKLPTALWEIGRTALRPGMMPGSSPFKFYARVGDWGRPKMGHADTPARALVAALLRALAQEGEGG